MTASPGAAGRGAYVVFAVLRARRGRADAFAQFMASHASASLAEPGCLRFDVSRGLVDDAAFLLYERYLDADAYRRHRDSAHYRRFRSDGVGFLETGTRGPFVERRVFGAATRDAPPVL